MKKILALFILIILFYPIFSQDIDLYDKNKNENYLLPELNTQMNLDEFQILSRNFRMQDMMFAAIVPGYVHFQAQDFATGYSVLAVRSAAYATFAYQSLWIKNNLTDSTLLYNLNNLSNLTPELKFNTYVLGSALFLIGSTYLFDIIHGKYRLKKKQETIRYKYSMKASLSSFNYPNSKKYNYGIGICLYF